MKVFLKSIDERVWNSVEYGWEKPTTPISEWQISQKEAAAFNSKAMAVTLSDDEVFDNESESDQEENFMAFTVTAVISETETKNHSDGELSKNANLQEAYNKLCKITARDAISVDVGLKKINTLVLEKKNLLLKLFGANELLNSV